MHTWARTIAVVAAAALLAGCGSSEQGRSEDSKSSVVTEATTTTASTTTTTEFQPLPVEIVSKGFTVDKKGSGSYAVVVKNPNAFRMALNISIKTTLYDAGGQVVKAEDDTLTLVMPSQSAAVADSLYEVVGAARMEVQALVGDWEQGSGGTFTAEGVRTSIVSSGYIQKTTASLKSTFAKDLKQVYAAAVHYNAAGALIGGSFTFVEFVPAGGSTGVEITTLSPIQGVARSEVYAVPSSMSLLD